MAPKMVLSTILNMTLFIMIILLTLNAGDPIYNDNTYN
jgi:hypothetical protein